MLNFELPCLYFPVQRNILALLVALPQSFPGLESKLPRKAVFDMNCWGPQMGTSIYEDRVIQIACSGQRHRGADRDY